MRIFTITITLICFFVSCDQKPILNPLQSSRISKEIYMNTGMVKGEFCTVSTEQTNRVVIMPITDLSGSNVQGNNGNNLGTDASGEKRFQNLIIALNDMEANPNRFFTGFGFRCPNCRANGVTEMFPGLDPLNPFTNDIEAFKQSVQLAWDQKPDNGGTPYQTWAQKAYDLILEDALRAKKMAEDGGDIVSTQYVLALSSDGWPTDSGVTVSEMKANIRPFIQRIMDLEDDTEVSKYITSVQINAAFYYHPDDPNFQGPEELLRYIAEDLGRGEFFAGADINWPSLFNVYTKKVNSEMLKFFVRNTNVVIDRVTGAPLRDSDGDGLSDQFEDEIGSNKFKKDSDHNGIDDNTESRLSKGGYPCLGLATGNSCDPRKALRTKGCFKVGDNQNPTDSDGDGISNCSEEFIGSDPLKWDTRGDKIPDHIAFLYFLPTVKDENNNDSNLGGNDYDQDGMTDYEEIVLGFHPRIPNRSLKGLPKYQYNYAHSSQGQYNPVTGQTCFDVTVENIGILSDEDIMEINIIDEELTNTSRKFFRTKKIKMKNGAIQFSEQDFDQSPLVN